MAGIYIHIPFCKKLCNYCDFYHVIAQDENSSYIDAIKKEAEIRQAYLAGDKIKTIYIGGGTPSVLSVKELENILDYIGRIFVIEPENEITIELNPDDTTENYLNDLIKIRYQQDKPWSAVMAGRGSENDEQAAYRNGCTGCNRKQHKGRLQKYFS